MKRIQLTLTLVVCTLITFSQQTTKRVGAVPFNIDATIGLAPKSTPSNSLRGSNSYWFHYVDSYMKEHSSQPQGWNFIITEDSTVMNPHPAFTHQGCWLNGIAQNYDFTSPVIKKFCDAQYTYTWDPSRDMQLDSISFPVNYFQVNDSITDTLIVRLVLGTEFGPIMNATIWPHLADTVHVSLLKFNTTTKEPMGYGNNEIKIAMDKQFAADTNQLGLNIVRQATNWTIPKEANGRFSVVFSYKAGSAWNAGTDVFKKDVNGIYLQCFELEGKFTHPKIAEGDDLNCTNAMTKSAYHDPSNIWYGHYVPSAVLMGDSTNKYWLTEALHLSLNISQENATTGVESTSNTLFTQITQDLYPNPASNEANIQYQLASPTQVRITITDITGKAVFIKNLGTQSKGEHRAILDISSLPSGAYHYTFSAGQVTSTNRLIIVK